MKHIVFIVANYKPYCDPTTRCAIKCTDYYRQKGYAVTIISFSKESVPAITESDGTQVITLRNYPEVCIDRISKVIPFFKYIAKIRSLIDFPHGFSWYTHSVLKELERLQQNNPVDAVFAVTAPYPALIAGLEWKKRYPKCKLINYIIDPYRFASIFEKILHFRKYKRIESQIYKLTDHIFVFDALQDQWSLYPSEKTDILHTAILEQQSNKKYCNDKYIHLAYTGGFYPKFRNPSYMMSVFERIINSGIRLHIYSNGTCSDILDPYYDKYSTIVIKEPWLPNDVLKATVAGMGILLNISNGIPGFLPSKLFEYIGTGLPIISFYTNGLKEKLLDRHPLVFQIDCDNTAIDSAAQMVADFIRKNSRRRLSFQEIKNIYPEYTAEYFTATIDKAMKKIGFQE